MEYLISLLPSEETIQVWLKTYGSVSLFIVMAMGIILLPVPEETLMMVTGVLISRGELNAIPTLSAAYLGSICGITTSYVIGRTLGHHLLVKYGGWVGVTHEKILRAHEWFEHYGKWTLFFGYFVPGVRHFTGLCAGTTYMEYLHFALFAYLGSIFWVSTFLSIGYFLGDLWHPIYEFSKTIVDEIIIAFIAIIALILLGMVIYKYYYKKTSG